MATPNFKTINKATATVVAGAVSALVVQFWPSTAEPLGQEATIAMQTLITFLLVYFGPANK